jgi:hypothetical protein
MQDVLNTPTVCELAMQDVPNTPTVCEFSYHLRWGVLDTTLSDQDFQVLATNGDKTL